MKSAEGRQARTDHRECWKHHKQHLPLLFSQIDHTYLSLFLSLSLSLSLALPLSLSLSLSLSLALSRSLSLSRSLFFSSSSLLKLLSRSLSPRLLSCLSYLLSLQPAGIACVLLRSRSVWAPMLPPESLAMLGSHWAHLIVSRRLNSKIWLCEVWQCLSGAGPPKSNQYLSGVLLRLSRDAMLE